MNLKESVQIVNYLHTSYPQDRNASKEELMQRAEAYHITFADYDYPTVAKAARHHIETCKWYPTTRELLDAVSWVRLTEPRKANVTPIPPKLKVKDGMENELLDAFCEWIGFGQEPDDNKDLSPFLPFEE
jgi:hypothetical protein